MGIVLAVVASPVWARTIVVDINGSGEFTSIQSALNVAVANDVVKVLPGTYEEQINITRNVTVQGSGYEITTITSAGSSTVTMSAGKIKWFAITAPAGTGINLSGGTVTNCVVRGCGGNGVRIPGGSTGIVRSCVIIRNVGNGVVADAGDNTGVVYDTISQWNSGDDFSSSTWNDLNVSYSNGTRGGNVPTCQSCLDTDPKFVSEADNNLHLLPTSASWDTGKPDILDPDGSRSDMGYFGGPDCPIAPVVSNLKITPQPGGTFIITAQGVANY